MANRHTFQGDNVGRNQLVLLVLIFVFYFGALTLVPALVEPYILGLPLWTWIYIALFVIHYALVYKYVKDYRDLDQMVVTDG